MLLIDAAEGVFERQAFHLAHGVVGHLHVALLLLSFLPVLSFPVRSPPSSVPIRCCRSFAVSPTGPTGPVILFPFLPSKFVGGKSDCSESLLAQQCLSSSVICTSTRISACSHSAST